ncbi:MAG: dehydrogenase [Fibrobacteres bacterium]|nr:dehydrogenase [Fibrobacterota bacterium]
MSIRVSLRHVTAYKYDRPVTLSPQLIRLRPAAHCRTRIEAYTLKVKPAGHFLNWQQDPFGNFMARVVFPEPQREFEVEVGLVADMTVINPFDFFVEPEADKFPFTYAPSLRESLAPYLEIREDGELLKAWLKKVDRKPRSIVDFLMDLNQLLPKEIKYCIRLESGVQSSEETLKLASGSCRDSAWLLVQSLRHLGIAARFASGYLIQLQPDKPPLEGPAGPVADFTDLHAWAEAYVPGAGWIGLDSTSGLMAGEGHIPLSCTPSPEDSAPISGGVSVCESTFDHKMELVRLREEPRVTAPIDDAQWMDLLALGDTVDKDMVAAGLDLTQGGEPTFVSIDDMDGAEWNTAALGEKKYAMANELTWRLQERFAPGAMLHYGQGKWYPGEPLPRWALTVMWRPDGKPVWRNAKLQAKEGDSGKYESKDAEVLARSIVRFLKLDAGFLKAAYEDAFYYLWKEGRLPADFDPKRTDWKSDAERARLLKLLEGGLDKVTGYVLPLAGDFDGAATRWRSDAWVFRRNQLFLLPGDSPLGYRLPLDSIPWGPTAPEFPSQLSPLAERPPLPDFPLPNGYGADTGPAKTVRAEAGKPTPPAVPRTAGTIRTALCVEARGGHLYVFFPPVTNLESFLELASVIEAAAGDTGLSVRVEGYRPPQDYRLKSFAITPDPGVIEVNIHPSASWRELVEKTEIIYGEAARCRLGAEKFQLDGRHTGTGGGNHIVLGSERPSDSPFLKRPHLLRSVVNFWQNHPSLSYLFSGLFIGPTSQSPRLDEARDDALAEMQLAFKQVPSQEALQPWQVDRIFRNLLVDLTGNTHRAELCIDKLYSPDSLSGRLGLLELRGFEMPPHPRLNAAQCLLVRALITRFWDHPYSAPLQPWGAALHDRWMLPHFLWADFEDVIGFLSRGGYEVRPEWYAPFLEFRFPRCGELQLKDISLEVRQAAEPWHVLGEEAAGSGTSRYVDSSLERLQVKVKGFGTKRHAVACNGIAMPLVPTGVAGEAVAGVRFRAWQPPSCLHPLIPIHAPLAFEVIDLWSGRSLGGCTYYVAHPAGRNYQTFPVNAAEAEARRSARFEARGHQPGPIRLKSAAVNPDHPLTLDLRRH